MSRKRIRKFQVREDGEILDVLLHDSAAIVFCIHEYNWPEGGEIPCPQCLQKRKDRYGLNTIRIPGGKGKGRSVSNDLSVQKLIPMV